MGKTKAKAREIEKNFVISKDRLESLLCGDVDEVMIDIFKMIGKFYNKDKVPEISGPFVNEESEERLYIIKLRVNDEETT